MNEIDFTSLTAVLMWLATAGGPYFVGYVLSLIPENWDWWHKLDRTIKFIVPMFLSVLVAIGATVTLKYTAQIQVISPWYTLIAVTIMTYLGSQKGYMKVKETGYGRSDVLKEAEYEKTCPNG